MDGVPDQPGRVAAMHDQALDTMYGAGSEVTP